MSQGPLPSDVAFTPSVKTVQVEKGSRKIYERAERSRPWSTRITPDLREFIEAQRSFFIATASADGQPTIQHRGGPTGFLKVVDETTLAFIDYVGNRQYITTGNLAENPRAHLFLIDYAQSRRIKIWGEASVKPVDDRFLASLMPQDYAARPEQVIVFSIRAWDANCPQHIPRRFDAEQVASIIRERDRRIEVLERRIIQLENGPPATNRVPR